MKFLFAMLIAVACSSPCVANTLKADPAYGVVYTQEQVTELPADQYKPYLTVYGNPSDPRYVAVQKWFETNATLKGIKDQCHFNAIPTNSVMFRDRYQYTTPNDLVVRLQAVDVDKPVVELVGNEIPMTADALANHLNVSASNAECFRRQRCQPQPVVPPDPTPQPLSPSKPPVKRSGPIWPWVIFGTVVSLVCLGLGVGNEWRKSRPQ